MNVSEISHCEEIALDDRRIITSSSAFGILRQQLVKNIGIDRIKGFLFHYGWEMGVNDAKDALKTNLSLQELIKDGPIRHIENGHIRGTQHNCTYELDEQHKITYFYSTGTWVDSYEAIEHIKRLGISKTQVCHTLIGFASGFMSTIFGERLLAKEVACVGKGDDVCRWEIKRQIEWEAEGESDLHFYNETPIVKELEYTYDQLLEQKNVVMRLADFQQKLTEEIINGSHLQTIANMVYDNLRIPILIEDTDHRTIVFAGVSEERFLELKVDMDQFIRENEQKDQLVKHANPLPFSKKIIKTENQERLITPIQVQKEVLGYCAFIYVDAEKEKHEEDYLLLDRFANAASLILLNEKTSFESFERMKGNFLEQIIEGKLPKSEIIKRGKFIGIDLGKPFFLAVMEYKKTQGSLEEEFLLQEHLFETTFRYFNGKKATILAGQYDGNIILLLTNDTVKNSPITDVLKEFHGYLMQRYPHGTFKFGISNVNNEIESAVKGYEEAVIALRLSVRKEIVPFQSLGIVGVLINSKNMNGIKMIAEQELGPLYNTEEPKIVELLKTLYFFLLNGGKLEQTMQDLSLSMSGLRHRINKIESLLEKDLREPNEMHQLLLIIKSLIALGEIEVD
ncbi:PucR family transcriptional regulator [Neobacillus bataviensis LMG 21833]|uniref:PucR family transcriptional regulator n=2 Tax=Neobacillus bataviensis TaxID=220685 RepID=K6C419_9BACI|nr:PucR family transcriptional regulator [Neobacillus bataviensis LMG 21833]